MSDINCIWCGPDKPPESTQATFAKTIHLHAGSRHSNVHLKIENISQALWQDIPAIVLDMLEIGSYVYCADQSVGRGGKVSRHEAHQWRRNFHFEIPVRNLDIWDSPKVKDELCEVLEFLSDDYYEFCFRQLTEDVPRDAYFDFDRGGPWFKANEVLLFSGGLDSLAGALDEMVNQGRKAVLVSHRPAPKISKRQIDLLKAFEGRGGDRNTFLHVPVWVNKDKGLTVDSNQRCRSFLYAMLGASVAVMHKIPQIKFFENGITSCNLPPTEQVIGTMASRSTHPAVLAGYSRLLTAILGVEFTVANPFIYKTKSEVVRVIKDSGYADLIRFSNSCSHVRSTDSLNTHCGVCSQCVGRQFAILHSGLSDFDSEDMYKSKLILDPIRDPEDRVMVASLVKQARYYNTMDEGGFFGQIGEVNRIIDSLGDPTSAAAEGLYNLHKRYGREVHDVLTEQIRLRAAAIADGKLDPDSILAMVGGFSKKRTSIPIRMRTFRTPPQTTWKDITIEIISNDSARIRVKDISEIYVAAEMGFIDRRRGDMVNTQWKTLLIMAGNHGQLNWGTSQKKRTAYKTIQNLKATLRDFFNIPGEPIKSYQKEIGYVAKFILVDRRGGR
ncbi:MAG: hypothetical protein PHR28_08700 [candidate division Zixibacteria bacterium]|nr:hypothetical protein [candidate division Zixibacteria bacterium]